MKPDAEPARRASLSLRDDRPIMPRPVLPIKARDPDAPSVAATGGAGLHAETAPARTAHETEAGRRGSATALESERSDWGVHASKLTVLGKVLPLATNLPAARRCRCRCRSACVLRAPFGAHGGDLVSHVLGRHRGRLIESGRTVLHRKLPIDAAILELIACAHALGS